MRTLNLSGLKAGDSLNISVSQGAITAGPVNVPAWGGAVPSGNITINVNRPHLSVAPESIRFSVDLSESNFDTPGPGEGEIYDPRMHDLIYLWDFDDAASGDWTAPINVLPGWKNRNTAKGPWVAHMYTRPGTYSPSVLVIEPSSGKTATAVLDGGSAITVADPDVVYSGANTICVNPVGDNDFTDAPTGAAQVNFDEVVHHSARKDQVWADRLGGSPKRWLFKRGGEFAMRIWLGLETPGLYLGAYGSGAKPILTSIPSAEPMECMLYTQGTTFGWEIQPTPPSLRMVDLNVKGNFDPTADIGSLPYEPGRKTLALYFLSIMDLIISRCDFTGWWGGSISFQPSGDYRLNASHFHMDDSTLNDFGGQYNIFGKHTQHPDGSWSCTGSRFAQNPLGLDDSTFRSPIRTEHWTNNHFRGCDFFHCDSTQTNVKILNGPIAQGAVVNAHSCSFEGGNQAFILGANTVEPLPFKITHSSVHNIVIDGFIYVGNHGQETMFMTVLTGATFRNNLYIAPGKNMLPGGTPCRSILETKGVGTFDASIADAPVRLYSNTMRVDRTTAQIMTIFSNVITPELIRDITPGGFTNITEHNNILHMPNLNTPVTTYGPLTDVSLWTPRTLGYRPAYAKHIGKYIGVDVPDGGSVFEPYWTLADGVTQLARAHIDESYPNHQLQINGGTVMTSGGGQFEMSFSDTGVTITNRSGATWPASAAYAPAPAMMENSPLQTTGFALSASDVKDSKPLPGSAALGAATTGNVSYMDILGTTRTAPADKGAWEVA